MVEKCLYRLMKGPSEESTAHTIAFVLRFDKRPSALWGMGMNKKMTMSLIFQAFEF